MLMAKCPSLAQHLIQPDRPTASQQLRGTSPQHCPQSRYQSFESREPRSEANQAQQPVRGQDSFELIQHRSGVDVVEQIKDIRADNAVGAIAVGGQRHRSIDEVHLRTVAPPRKPVSCQRDHHRADIHPEIARGRRQQFQHPHGQPARATTELKDGMRRLRCKVGEQPRHGAVFIELPILCPTDPVVYGPRLRRLHPRPVPRATSLRMADCGTTNTHFPIRSRQTLAKTSGPRIIGGASQSRVPRVFDPLQ